MTMISDNPYQEEQIRLDEIQEILNTAVLLS